MSNASLLPLRVEPPYNQVLSDSDKPDLWVLPKIQTPHLALNNLVQVSLG